MNDTTCIFLNMRTARKLIKCYEKKFNFKKKLFASFW